MEHQSILIDIINEEIQDRGDTAYNLDDDNASKLLAEITELTLIRSAVESKKDLDFNQYCWLCDLVAAYAQQMEQNNH